MVCPDSLSGLPNTTTASTRAASAAGVAPVFVVPASSPSAKQSLSKLRPPPIGGCERDDYVPRSGVTGPAPGMASARGQNERPAGENKVTTQTQPGGIGEPEELDELASWSALEQLGRALRVPEAGLQATLEAIASTAVETIGPARYAGVNLYDHGKFMPQAVAGEPPLTLDVLQQETGTGPCIDASRDQATIRVDDMTTELRWPEYTKLAVDLGVAGILCVPLWVDDQQLGSVSLLG